jgi:hypothetical protein
MFTGMGSVKRVGSVERGGQSAGADSRLQIADHRMRVVENCEQ